MGVNVCFFFRAGGVEGANACCVMTVNNIQASSRPHPAGSGVLEA